MIQSKLLQVEHTQPSEFSVELGQAHTASTNLAAADVSLSATATPSDTTTGTGDGTAPSRRAHPGPLGRGSFASAAVLGLGGMAIILLYHFCARDHDFIAALVGVAFCLSGWGLASRSFPHTTREYSTSPRGSEENP